MLNINYFSVEEEYVCYSKPFRGFNNGKFLAEMEGCIIRIIIHLFFFRYPGVVVLSIEDQKKSGFEIARNLKHGLHHKNIGYLYAIQHGAKYIYDTEFNNYVTNVDASFDHMTNENEYLTFNGNKLLYNGLAHFGQNKLWPRGYPLDLINETQISAYKTCKNVHSVIQHGIAEGDPDIDALQRLTMRDNKINLDVYFDSKAPLVVLPPNSFTPYGSENTLYQYDAFFSLLLPQTVTSRVSDIWRSFLTQRLLWDIGSQLSLSAIKSHPKPKLREFLKELRDEEELYLNSNLLANLLIKWNCDSNDIFTRYFEVIKEMYKKGMIGASDVTLAQSWIKDLVRVDYKPPKMQSSMMECKPNETFLPKRLMDETRSNDDHIVYYKSLATHSKESRSNITDNKILSSSLKIIPSTQSKIFQSSIAFTTRTQSTNTQLTDITTSLKKNKTSSITAASSVAKTTNSQSTSITVEND